MIDITPVIQALLALICAVITCVLVPYIRSKTAASQQEEIQNWVTIAVQAAEQIYQETNCGKAKKAYVLEWLNEHGIAVDDTKIDAIIESAVHQLNSSLLCGPVYEMTVTEEDAEDAEGT